LLFVVSFVDVLLYLISFFQLKKVKKRAPVQQKKVKEEKRVGQQRGVGKKRVKKNAEVCVCALSVLCSQR
jgi:hypothetical protein